MSSLEYPIRYMLPERADALRGVELVRMFCRHCGQGYSFTPETEEARGVVRVFCPNGICEDKYVS